MKFAPLLAALALSCSEAPAPSRTPVFSGSSLQTINSASGSLRIELFEEVDRPVSRGPSNLRLGVTSDTGMDVDALTLSVTPWMPVMGHGSAKAPVITPADGGFLITDVYLSMPGQWELRFDFEGSLTDHALALFDIE